ncbi:MAG: hypothetical protein M3O46_22180, partial [Myxococcota bacterium]|nr:hypothetical protein [Myxococcota bacterium]
MGRDRGEAEIFGSGAAEEDSIGVGADSTAGAIVVGDGAGTRAEEGSAAGGAGTARGASGRTACTA